MLCLFYLIYLLLLIQLIDHDNLFCNRTQRVQIDDVLSDFANIMCGVPQ